MEKQRCDNCDRQFQPAKSWQRFCTPKCRDAWHYEQWKLAQADVGQVNGHGAVSGTAIVEAIKSRVAPVIAENGLRRRAL